MERIRKRKDYYAGYTTVGESGGINITSEDFQNKVITFDVEIITLPGPTRNGMLYPLENMKKAVADQRVQDMLKRGAYYGEGEHPLDPEDFRRWVANDVKNRHFKWTKIWFEGNKMMGTVQTVTLNGNMMYEAIKCGELPAFSIRVIGTPKKKGEYTELHDIVLISIDWVGYPGNPTSYVQSSDAFKLEDMPIASGFDRDSRIVGKSEADEILGLGENMSLINMGKGIYSAVEQLNNKQKDNLSFMRRNAF